jgi:hypothetical protein
VLKQQQQSRAAALNLLSIAVNLFESIAVRDCHLREFQSTNQISEVSRAAVVQMRVAVVQSCGSADDCCDSDL